MLLAFIVGAISTIIGTLVTYPLLPLKSLGSDSWKVASALAARHIGGTSHRPVSSKCNHSYVVSYVSHFSLKCSIVYYFIQQNTENEPK
jgi:hypothetical protein